MNAQNSIPAPSKALESVLLHIRKGGLAYVATYTRAWYIDAKTLAKWDNAQEWLLKEDGDGYRMRTGKNGKSCYLFPGQLRLSA